MSKLTAFLDRQARRFSVEPMRPDSLQAVVRLFKETWHLSDSMADLVLRFVHRFERNPLGSANDAIQACYKGDDLAGFSGVVDTEIWHGDTCHPAAYPVDMVVEPRYRALGVALLIQRALNARRSVVVEGNLNEAARQVAEALGAKPIAPCTVCRRWLRPTDLVRPMGRVRRITRFDERFDRLWERARGAGPFIARRDRAVLAWRYERNPRTGFRIYAIGDVKLEGYVVVHVAPWRHFRTAALVDFLFADASAPTVRECFAAALAETARRGAVRVDAIVTEPRLRGALQSLGFRCRGADFGFLLHGDLTEAASPGALDSANWHLTFGDSDFYL